MNKAQQLLGILEEKLKGMGEATTLTSIPASAVDMLRSLIQGGSLSASPDRNKKTWKDAKTLELFRLVTLEKRPDSDLYDIKLITR